MISSKRRPEREEGIFGDHLRRILLSLRKDMDLVQAVTGVLTGQPFPAAESFYRLRSAGVLTGDTAKEAKPRCQLYSQLPQATSVVKWPGDSPFGVNFQEVESGCRVNAAGQ